MTEKAAALLLCMDKSLAKRLLARFDDSEVRLVAQTAARLGALPPHRLEELVEEFASAFVSGSDIQGTPQSAAQLLDGVLPSDKLSEIITDIEGNSSSRVWTTLGSVPELALTQYLNKQHPQVVTLVISRLPGALAAAVLEQLPATIRIEVVRRLLTLKDIAPAAMRIIEQNLQSEFVNKTARTGNTDVHARIASVLNKMGREVADATFSGLSASKPKDAEKIKGLLFTFNDVARLGDEARAKLFEGVPVELTIAALHGADENLRGLIMSVISQRSRRMIETELQNGRVPSKSEIGKAQRSVADRALELVERGTIELPSDM